MPEPWSGHIGEAPILFVSSNPSLSDRDVFPTGDWSDDDIVDFFGNRFGGGQRQWIKDGTKGLGRDGSHLPATMFWAGIRRRAAELLERSPRPGIDYALTEVVHCKSRSEYGVAEALNHCKRLYLNRVVAASAASVVVVLGAIARDVITSELGTSCDTSTFGPVHAFGRERVFAFLPHPNARTKRTFTACMAADELDDMRCYLGS